jgi:serine/threonine protein phosphatase PrpC
MKGSQADAPNQDSFSYTHLVGGWIICIVCDGHGEQGEVISERVARTIPLLLGQHLAASMKMDEALNYAFLQAQDDLEKAFMTQQVYSGAAVAVCCLNLESNETWFAHAGDSRVVLGDLVDGRIACTSEDHKAHVPAEGERLERAGAQVVMRRYGEGEVISRVFIPRTGVPGLAMSRSLGDGCLKRYGVVAEPEVNDVSRFWHECKEPIIVMGSDGLWDTIDLEEAMNALASRRASSLDVRQGAENLCRRAQRLWIEEEDDYCDDATVLIMAPGQLIAAPSADARGG